MVLLLIIVKVSSQRIPSEETNCCGVANVTLIQVGISQTTFQKRPFKVM